MQGYPITTPYGQVPGYPLNNGFHKGIDYGAPVGTPVVVNGVTIGLSGNTGASTGPHLHVGRWVNGQSTDPGVGGGFQLDGAVVTEVNSDSVNGNYVRIRDTSGASWVYLHLSKQLVKAGDKLGGNMPYVEQAVIDDLENWKKVGLVFANRKEWEAMGGITGAPNADPNQINLVMDDLEKNKEENLSKQMASGDVEATAIGKALIKLFQTFGYKKG